MSLAERTSANSRDNSGDISRHESAPEESALGCPPGSPLGVDSLTAQSPDNLESQLETLKLRVSLGTQKDIQKILESLQGMCMMSTVPYPPAAWHRAC